MSERIMLRFERGKIVPDDQYSAQRIREAGYKIGDVVHADLRKPRNPAFWRLAHVLGQMLVDNVAGFEHLTPHQALKRIQLEGDIGCDEIPLNFPGIGPCSYRVPRSLSFQSMDETEFNRIWGAMCAWIAKTYWPGLTPEQVQEMAETMT